MLRSALTWFLLFSVALAVAACCGSVPCDCQDIYADALFFRFNVDSASGAGFRAAQVKSVYLLRYPLPADSTLTSRPDTIKLLRPGIRVRDSIVINNNLPFTQAGTRRLSAYRYDIYLPRTAFRYHVRKIQLKGSYQGDGCCTCYRNTGKSVEINGKPYDVTDPTGQGKQPVYITLGR